MIFDSVALSQAPAEAARPWTRASVSHGVPVYFPVYAGTKLYCLVTEEMRMTNCPWSHPTVQRLGWNSDLQSQVQRSNRYAADRAILWLCAI